MLPSNGAFCVEKSVKIGFISVVAAIMASLASIIFAPALYAVDLSIQGGVNAAQGSGTPATLFGNGGMLTAITNMLLFIVGALSVLMIIIGGLRYVTSGGNATSVTSAKNTILYAIVGLVVAFLAYAAINFVLGTLMGNSSVGTDV